MVIKGVSHGWCACLCAWVWVVWCLSLSLTYFELMVDIRFVHEADARLVRVDYMLQGEVGKGHCVLHF